MPDHGNNAFETNQNKGANRSADAGKPPIEPEAPIDLAHEEIAAEGQKIHPLVTARRLMESFPGMHQTQLRRHLAEAHDLSMAPAGQIHRVAKKAKDEHDEAYRYGQGGPEKQAARQLPPRVPLETYRGVPAAHEQEGIAPTPATPAASPPHEGMHAYNYHKDGAVHVGHSTSEQGARIHQAYFESRGGHGAPVHLAAKAGKAAPVGQEQLDPTYAQTHERKGFLAPPRTEVVEPVKRDATAATRPNTLHHGLLDQIERFAHKNKKPGLAQAAHEAKSNQRGAHEKVGNLLPKDHWAKDEVDWHNEEQNQHLDNWVEEHVKKTLNMKDSRTAALSQAQLWEKVHKQFGGSDNSKNQYAQAFWDKMHDHRAKGGSVLEPDERAHMAGKTRGQQRKMMQEAIERIRNKHVDQEFFRKQDGAQA